MMMKHTLSIIAFLLCVYPTQAQDSTKYYGEFQANTVSAHRLDAADSDLNWQNIGLGLQLNIASNLDAQVGFYYNSWYIMSTYGGLGINFYESTYFRGGIVIGGVTGYGRPTTFDMRVLPVIVPKVSIGDVLRINVLGYPPFLIGFQVGISLDSRQ
jgi:hypothetical protein